MSNDTHTVITTPAVEIVHAEIEFHIADGEVKFAQVKARDTINIAQAAAIAKAIHISNQSAAS